MATILLTNGNDTRLLNVPGTYVVDGLAGIDTMDFGREPISDYTITRGADGGVRVDTLSGASQSFSATLYNFEFFVFGNGSQRIELATYFSATEPPVATFTDFTSGTATGTVAYELKFNKPVTGLALDDFQVSGGTVTTLSGSGAAYNLSVQPTPGAEGTIALTLKAGAVADGGGLANIATTAAAQPYDTLAPRIAAASPASGATGAGTTAPIVIDFTEAVRGGTGTVVLRDAAGAQLGFWSSSDIGVLLSGTRLTLTPTQPLPAGATVRVELGAAVVQDLAGNAFAATSYTYTTSGVTQRTGTAGNDSFALPAGVSSIDGAGGIDQVVAGAARAGYTLTAGAGGWTLATLDGATRATLVNVERVAYADQKLALDLSGNAGLVAKTLGAVLGRDSVKDAAIAGVGLSLVDAGTGYTALMQLALDYKLGAGASHAAVVDLLYTNVVGSAPSADARAFYVALLDNGTYTPAILGTIAADTELNLANVDFVGLSQGGLVYT